MSKSAMQFFKDLEKSSKQQWVIDLLLQNYLMFYDIFVWLKIHMPFDEYLNFFKCFLPGKKKLF